MATMETTDAPQMIEHKNVSLTYTPYETRWVPCSARFVCCGITPKAKGKLEVYELQAGQARGRRREDPRERVQVWHLWGFVTSERSIATGDYKGGLNIFDLERLDVPTFSIPTAHSQIINGIDGVGGLGIGGGAPELVTGSRDGCVRVWDPRVKESVVSLEPVEGQPVRDCWTVAFGNSL